MVLPTAVQHGLVYLVPRRVYLIVEQLDPDLYRLSGNKHEHIPTFVRTQTYTRSDHSIVSKQVPVPHFELLDLISAQIAIKRRLHQNLERLVAPTQALAKGVDDAKEQERSGIPVNAAILFLGSDAHFRDVQVLFDHLDCEAVRI